MLAGGDRAAPEPEGSSRSSEASSPDQAFQDWQLKFAECMRAEGVDMPDPSGSGSQQLELPDDMGAFETAAAVCQEKLGDPPLGQAGRIAARRRRAAEGC